MKCEEKAAGTTCRLFHIISSFSKSGAGATLRRFEYPRRIAGRQSATLTAEQGIGRRRDAFRSVGARARHMFVVLIGIDILDLVRVRWRMRGPERILRQDRVIVFVEFIAPAILS
jgi:hypothetical protein